MRKISRRDFIGRSASIAAAATLLPVCTKAAGRQRPGAAEKRAPMKVSGDKILVVYFSRSGNTRHVAETFAKACGGVRLVEIKAAKPYAAEYSACCEEAKPECRTGTLRAIQKIADLDLSRYDAVIVGTPNWWGTLAPPVRTWLSENSAALKAKTLCLFQTHGGGGMQNCARDFAALVPGANVLPAKSYLGATVKARPNLKAFVAERFAIE